MHLFQMGKIRQREACRSFKEGWRFNDCYNFVVSKNQVLCDIFKDMSVYKRYEFPCPDCFRIQNNSERRSNEKDVPDYNEVLIIVGPWNENTLYFDTSFDVPDKEMETIVNKNGGYDTIKSIISNEASPKRSYPTKTKTTLRSDTHKYTNYKAEPFFQDFDYELPPLAITTGVLQTANSVITELWYNFYKRLKSVEGPILILEITDSSHLRRLILNTKAVFTNVLEPFPIDTSYRDTLERFPEYKFPRANIYRFRSYQSYEVDVDYGIMAAFQRLYELEVDSHTSVWNCLPCDSSLCFYFETESERVDPGLFILDSAHTPEDDPNAPPNRCQIRIFYFAEFINSAKFSSNCICLP